MTRRAAALWLFFFAVYSSTLGLDAFGQADYAGDEPHYLLAAQSLAQDGDLDVKDDFTAQEWRSFHPYELEPQGSEVDGRLHEPHADGLAILAAPAFAIGGAKGVELLLAALAALAIALAYLLALRVAPDPWAGAAALAVGVSAPVLAHSTAVYPELAASAVLAGAALLALSLDGSVRRRKAFACFALLGLLPWLGLKFLPAAVVIGAYAARSMFRARRRVLAVGSVEVSLFSLTLCVAINQALYGGPTPYWAALPGEGATEADQPLGYLERAYRLVALMIDRDYGLLRWAPVFVLAFAGLWFTYRSRRELLARAVPQLREMERAATMCAAAVGAHLLVAAFLAPTMFGPWFPPRYLVAGLVLAVPLVALGLRHLPRTGTALALLSLAASVWLWLDVRLGGGGLVEPRPDAPFGPLTALLPRFDDSAWPYVLAALVGVAAVVAGVWEARRARDGGAAQRARAAFMAFLGTFSSTR